MIMQTIDGIPFPLEEPCDLSFLSAWGRVFQVFSQNDSGNVSFGVQGKNGRFFIKVAGAKTIHACVPPDRAVETLRAAVPLYRELTHPRLIRLLDQFSHDRLYGAVFQWAEGKCLFDHWNFDRYAATGELPPRDRFRGLPVEEKLDAFAEVFDFLTHVENRGYAAVDFYDSSLLYDFTQKQLSICDIDLFRPRPLVNILGPDYPGTKRLKAPEEYLLGAEITPATGVFTLGALLFHFFGSYTQEELQQMYQENRFFPCRRETWQLSPKRYAIALKAVDPVPFNRYHSLKDFRRDWESDLI